MRRCVLACALVVAMAGAAYVPAGATAAAGAGLWHARGTAPAAGRHGLRPGVRPDRFRALDLKAAALDDVLRAAPPEDAAASLTIALPRPGGGFERFAVRRSQIMTPRLAADHPGIRTYAGRGVDDPAATVHLDTGPAGLHASVRSPLGAWYIDPYNRGNTRVYAAYRAADLPNVHGTLATRGGDVLQRTATAAPLAPAAPFAGRFPGGLVDLRDYRLALLTDPTYARYQDPAHPSAPDDTIVQAAKVALVDRVDQVYEDDLGIRMQLVAGNLDLNTDAAMTGPDGPCGAQACFAADQLTDGCSSPVLTRARIVLGQLAGADHFDIGHLAMGTKGGGLAALGVVGGSAKAEGCTGVTTPVGDYYAVDYVAHEMGHEFGADHTFNGTAGACGGGNRHGPTAVEPGSGSSVMAYAGICGADDLQPHSDPYFSERSQSQITTYVSGLRPSLAEVQTGSLDHFGPGASFHLSYNGTEDPTPITEGGTYGAGTLRSVIQALTGLSVQSVTGFDGTGAPDDTGFQVRFAGVGDVAPLSLTSLSGGVTGFIGTTVQGGAAGNGGAISTPGNHAPVVAAAPNVTIPVRTPFTLTGAATDADPGGAAALTYMWEQTDAGSTPTALLSNTKPNGPLFRQFGTAAAEADPFAYNAGGENATGADPRRTFPDLAQVVAGDTNAATGRCPAGHVACFSEFLPTAAYGPAALHFRLTARDGAAPAGGVGFADTTVTLAKSSGPFRVTSQAAPASAASGGPVRVTWSVAGTNAAPVSAGQVEILLSTDGGQTFPTVLAGATPNDGGATVTLPPVTASAARIMVRAVGNVFFDVSHANLAIVTTPAPVPGNDAPDGGAPVQYGDSLGPPVTVSAYDSDSPGSALTATAAGLPSGLALHAGTTGAHTRTWTVSGTDAAVPGSDPVTVLVSDGTHTGSTTFTVVVRPEDATAAYTGPSRARAPVGAASARVHLRAHVTEAADGSPSGLAGATVTFQHAGAVLCGPVPVSGGNAGCRGAVPVGAASVQAVVGGTYAGTATAVVSVRPSHLTPDLSRVHRHLRVRHSGRLRLRVACHHSGRTPHRCRGTLKLRAKVGGRRRTIARARFSVRRHHVRRVRLHLRSHVRRATLTMTVTNVTPHARASKRLRLRG